METTPWSREYAYQEGRPKITIRVKKNLKSNGRFLTLLVDSGSDTSILPANKAALIGIDYKTLKGALKNIEIAHYTPVLGKECNIYLEMEREVIKIPALITQDDIGSILGRKGFFNAFDILFQEKLHQFTVTKS